MKHLVLTCSFLLGFGVSPLGPVPASPPALTLDDVAKVGEIFTEACVFKAAKRDMLPCLNAQEVRRDLELNQFFRNDLPRLVPFERARRVILAQTNFIRYRQKTNQIWSEGYDANDLNIRLVIATGRSAEMLLRQQWLFSHLLNTDIEVLITKDAASLVHRADFVSIHRRFDECLNGPLNDEAFEASCASVMRRKMDDTIAGILRASESAVGPSLLAKYQRIQEAWGVYRDATCEGLGARESAKCWLRETQLRLLWIERIVQTRA